MRKLSGESIGGTVLIPRWEVEVVKAQREGLIGIPKLKSDMRNNQAPD